MKSDFETYKQLHNLLKRYIRYCFSFKNENYNQWDIDKLTDEFISKYDTKDQIERWFSSTFNRDDNNENIILSPKSYYDLELKLALRGY